MSLEETYLYSCCLGGWRSDIVTVSGCWLWVKGPINIYNSYITRLYRYLIKDYSIILPPRKKNKIHINKSHIAQIHVQQLCTCTLNGVSFIDTCTHAVMRRNSSITYRSTCPLSTAASLFLFKFVFPSTNFAQCKIDYATV